MNLEEYKKQFEEDAPVGWDFIDTELVKIYSQQKPLHFAPALQSFLLITIVIR